MDRYDRFGEAMQDGRITEPSDGKKYRLREAIAFSEQVGRLLTQEEMQRFEIDSSDINKTEIRKKVMKSHQDIQDGKGRSAEEFFEELEIKYSSHSST